MVRTMSHAECVLYEDHCAALKAARNELPDVGSWSPEAKFKVGDRVQWDADLGTVAEPDDESSPRQEPYYVNVNWDDGNYGTVRSSDLSLYVPPVTNSLREHESVRYDDHSAAIKAAVLAERERCLEIVENIHGYCVKPDGGLSQDPEGEMVIRMRVETAIRWVKVK